MMLPNSRFYSLWLCFFTLMSMAYAQEISLQASVSHNPVWINQQLTYTLEISGSTTNLPDIRMPGVAEFRVLSGPNRSSSYQIVNGKVSSKLSYSMVLLARKPGKFTIPAVAVTHSGRTFRSNPITVEVTSQPPSGSGNNTQNKPQGDQNKLFLRVIPSKRSAFINEPIDVSVRLYFRVPVRGPEFLELPKTVGFWVEEYELPQNIPVSNEVINGVQYQVAEIKKMALFPSRTGELTISESQLQVSVVERRRRSDPFNVMDDFFSDPFGRSVKKVLASRPVKITVKPLPDQGKPENFSGLVGSYRLTTSVDKSDVQTNEAFSYNIRLSGNGNLKSLANLNLDFPSAFEVYDPKVKNNIRNAAGARFSATQEMEYVLIPRVEGDYQVGPLEISYFDPSSKRYKTLSGKGYSIQVSAGESSLSGLSGNFVSKSDVQVLGSDINFIKEGVLDLLPVNEQPHQSLWFWGGLAAPLLALLGALFFRRHSDQLNANQSYARSRSARRSAHKRLKGAEKLLAANDISEFYAEMSRGLTGFLADKSNREAAGMTRTDIEEIFADGGIEETLKSDFMSCLDEADFRRFAPGEQSLDQAKALFDKGGAILDRLTKVLS